MAIDSNQNSLNAKHKQVYHSVTMSFPTKEERAQCWNARDKYWECLDGQKGEENACREFRKLYEKSCSAQWVKHFDRKRNYLQFKEKIEKDGYESLNEKRFTPS